MVTVYGMNERVGNVSFYDPTQENTFTKPFSEETGKIIDEEVRKIIDVAYLRTKALLTEKKVEVEMLAKALLDKEVLHQSDVEKLIGKRPYEEKKLLDDVNPTKDDGQSANDKHHAANENIISTDSIATEAGAIN